MAKQRELKTRKDGVKQHYNTGSSVTSNADARAAFNPRPAKKEEPVASSAPVAEERTDSYQPDYANLVALGAFAQSGYGAYNAAYNAAWYAEDREMQRGDEWAREYEGKRLDRLKRDITRSYDRLDEKITSGMRYDRNWLAYSGDTSESARVEYKEVREAVIATETKRLSKKLGITEAAVKSRVDSIMRSIAD